MCSPARSSVGEQAARQAPALCWILWSNASHKRRPSQDKLVHHSDRRSQYLLTKYTKRLAKAKIAPSVGCVADPYSSWACCACSGGQRTVPWPRRSMACSKPKSFAAGAPRATMELSNATLEWVNHGVVEETPWFNNRRLLELIGNIAPAEAEANFHTALERADLAAWLKQIGLRQTWDGSMRMYRWRREHRIGRKRGRHAAHRPRWRCKTSCLGSRR
jgi:putative transposase